MRECATQLDNEPVDVVASRLPAPVLTYLGDRRWRLEDDYTYHDRDHRITVAAGFEFDLSSVPRALWSVIAPFELSIVAPLVHDFLYEYGGDPPPGSIQPPRTYTRREVDDMFRSITETEGVAPWRRRLAYWAVRTFGRWAWRDGAAGP
jgi:hypothetical protein